MEEIWKQIDGFSYEVSSKGNIRRIGANSYKKQKTTNCGYKSIQLYKKGKSKEFLCHRLVAIAFIPNPDNLPLVNHINEDKTDNSIENLEWCDSKYNNNYGTIRERRSKSKMGELNPNFGKNLSESTRQKMSVSRKGHKAYNNKPICQFTKEGKLINIFESALKAAISLNNYNLRGNITKACKGKIKTCNGYIWKYQNTINSQKSDNTDEEN